MKIMGRLCPQLTVALFAAVVLSACVFYPEQGETGTEGNLVLMLPGSSSARAVISDDSVQKLLRYDITLTGPGGQQKTKSAGYQEQMSFNLSPGAWNIKVEAFFPGKTKDTRAGGGVQSIELTPGSTKTLDIEMILDGALEDWILIPNADEFIKIGTAPADGGFLGGGKKLPVGGGSDPG
ncbi:hypothetical protein AGMMS50293_10160 [Spirochaetia bacterium]|nr:hypothetical protein AGMMS50293_10160 [Spirochaetia bacterium]